MKINFDSVKSVLEGVLKTQEASNVFYLNPAKGKGFISYINVQDGLAAFHIDLTFKETTNVPLSFIPIHTVQFLFCQEGSLIYDIPDGDVQKVQIEQYQTAVIYNNENIPTLSVVGDSHLKLRVLVVDGDTYFESFTKEMDLLDNSVKAIQTITKNATSFVKVGSFGLSIAEQYAQIEQSNPDNEVSGSLSQKGFYYIILAKHIQKFSNEMNSSLNESSLRQNELKRIIDLSNHIKKHPEASHNIRLLCQATGLSPAKIQEGFKFLHNTTVSNYVCEVRLEKAEELIRFSDLTISEIVYTVGLTSRSYFCKIFKKKFNYSPKVYRNRIKHKIVAPIEDL